jgi:hypothetical protein
MVMSDGAVMAMGDDNSQRNGGPNMCSYGGCAHVCVSMMW